MSDASIPRAFVFQTEFLPNGDVVGGADRRFFSREEAERLAAVARSEGEAKAQQTVQARGFASVDRIAGHLAPVAPQIAAIADQLRREAAELAIIAARRIAGEALDRNGVEAAGAAIERAVRLLKSTPTVVVTASPDSAAEIARRMEQLRRDGRVQSISFQPDPKARPGDWRIEWGEGAVGFSREDVEAAIDAVIKQRLDDPVEPQLDLFSAA